MACLQPHVSSATAFVNEKLHSVALMECSWLTAPSSGLAVNQADVSKANVYNVMTAQGHLDIS